MSDRIILLYSIPKVTDCIICVQGDLFGEKKEKEMYMSVLIVLVFIGIINKHVVCLAFHDRLLFVEF